ncbi:hypothetical protein [Halomonas sp. QHL1]|uniref:hypothetical protein n=1 Tax=Halomonas sp. QHL1 TaxID=1123773 RepID=UPI0008FD25AE|nr:hypothetical protein [Halomonas sp. QHL1]OJA05446.1 hypothetical protein QHL1GM_08590 [Halomonas sp. QHL1]
MPELWLVAVAIATPTAGIVGFLIQFRTLQKARLENVKLRLEIDQHKQAQKASEGTVRVATHEETIKYSDQLYSLRRPAESEAIEDDIGASSKRPLRGAVIQFALWFGVALFIVCLAYDVFRVSRWLWSLV